MKDHLEYIITGGKDGKSRLNILSEALYPYTRSLLQAQGISKGQSFLDLGCGGGNIALLAAELVGNKGAVTAVDFDDTIVALAQQDADASGTKNISFEVLSAYDISYSNRFDTAYARFLLSHLKDPLLALQKMVQSTKPGGNVIVEDVHFSGHFCYPENMAFNKYVRYYTIAAALNGHNAEIGPSLSSLFHQAGLEQIGFDVVLPCFNNGSGKWMAYVTLDRIKETLVREAITNEHSVDRMLTELEDFTKDEQTIMSLPHIFRVWGRKKVK